MDCSERVIRFYSGSFEIDIPRGEEFTFYATYMAGEWDRLHLGEGDIVMDAGANVGDFALKAAAKVGPKGIVIAVEPSPTARKRLVENLKLNGTKNVIVSDAFLSNEAREISVDQRGSYLVATTDGSPDSHSIVGVTPSALVSQLSVASPTVLKMDIEGSEVSALSDTSFLRQLREIAVETHNHFASERVSESLTSLGFSLRRFNSFDLFANSTRYCVRHPVSLLRAEIDTRGYAIRRLGSLLRRRPDVPSLRPETGVEILYGRMGRNPDQKSSLETVRRQ